MGICQPKEIEIIKLKRYLKDIKEEKERQEYLNKSYSRDSVVYLYF